MSVSFVLLNWNSEELGAAAAASVRRQSHHDVELVVVDNASDDGSLPLIRDHRPDRVIELATNTGFANGMNLGVDAARGDAVVLLNSDATVPSDFAARVATRWVQGSDVADVGAVGGLEVDINPTTSRAIGAEPQRGPYRLSRTMRVAYEPVDQSCDAEAVTASALVLPRRAIDAVQSRFGQLFDPRYHSYGEDIDLFRKLARLGLRVVFDAGLRSTHYRSFASTPRLADKRGRLRVNVVTNRHANIIRHSATAQLGPNLAAAAVEDLGFCALRLAARDLGATRDVGRAWAATASRTPSHLRFRREHGPGPRHDATLFSFVKRY